MNFINNNLRFKPVWIIATILGIILVWIYLFGIPTLKSESRVSLRELLSASVNVAQRGGSVVRTIREKTYGDLHTNSKGLTKEGARELYTKGDMESHKVMTYGIRKAFPLLTVISEEKSKVDIALDNIIAADKFSKEINSIQDDVYVAQSDIAVWIDPLDATQEYTENLTQYVTTMVCVAVKGVPIIGVIHRPFKPETVWAWVGHGHSANLKTAPTLPTKQSSRIIVSRSHAGDVISVAKKAFGDNVVVIPAGGAGYKTLAVINGEADVYVHRTLIKKWDICAGNAILREVSGRMTDLQGTNVDYSASGNYKNERGLIASITNHDTYLQKLQFT